MQVGDTARRSRPITQRDIELFTELTGDRNPLHYDEEAASRSRFGGLIIQGGVTSGLLNAVVAEDLPGPGSVFLHVDWDFKAPVRPGDGEWYLEFFSDAEQIPLPVLKAGVDVTWESVGDYLNALGKKRGINVGTLVGHSGIRRYVMGEAASEREATPEELAAMELDVNQEFENMGLGTTQVIGPVLDGLMRNTPDALHWIEVAEREGVSAVAGERDRLFADYSAAPPGEQPDPEHVIEP
jgi:hypothetical protein